jgi:hypothetical protein
MEGLAEMFGPDIEEGFNEMIEAFSDPANQTMLDNLIKSFQGMHVRYHAAPTADQLEIRFKDMKEAYQDEKSVTKMAAGKVFESMAPSSEFEVTQEALNEMEQLGVVPRNVLDQVKREFQNKPRMTKDDFKQALELISWEEEVEEVNPKTKKKEKKTVTKKISGGDQNCIGAFCSERRPLLGSMGKDLQDGDVAYYTRVLGEQKVRHNGKDAVKDDNDNEVDFFKDDGLEPVKNLFKMLRKEPPYDKDDGPGYLKAVGKDFITKKAKPKSPDAPTLKELEEKKKELAK